MVVLFVCPLFVFAQTDPATSYVPLAPLPNQPAEYSFSGASQTALPDYLSLLYKLGIGAAGILAVLMLVWGGFQYSTSEAVTGKSEGKQIIQNVIWGLAVVLGSFVLLYTINPRLVDVGLALKTLGSVTKTSVPTTQEAYGIFLDNMLKKVNDTSLKARDLKLAADAVQKRLEDGDYTTKEEGDQLVKTYKDLKVKEEIVRNYEQALNTIEVSTKNMLDCLNGKGPCMAYVNDGKYVNFVRKKIYGPSGRPPEQVAKDQAEAEKYVMGAKNYLNNEISTLKSSNLNDQASDLQNKLDSLVRHYEFWKQCPNADFQPGQWQVGNACP